jgi:hypothetical protein
LPPTAHNREPSGVPPTSVRSPRLGRERGRRSSPRGKATRTFHCRRPTFRPSTLAWPGSGSPNRPKTTQSPAREQSGRRKRRTRTRG